MSFSEKRYPPTPEFTARDLPAVIQSIKQRLLNPHDSGYFPDPFYRSSLRELAAVLRQHEEELSAEQLKDVLDIFSFVQSTSRYLSPELRELLALKAQFSQLLTRKQG